MSVNIITKEVGGFATNCYLVYDDNNTGVIIDPGDNATELEQIIKNHHLNIEAILLTHGHCDHLIGAAQLERDMQLPLYIHSKDTDSLNRCQSDAVMLGLECKEVPQISGTLEDGQIFKVGSLEFKIIHTPGHTPGGIVLLCGRHAFCGDTIFHTSIGRTDFFGGSHSQLINSIKNKIYTLPEDTILYPGHGSQSSVGYEKRNNPFVRV
ncbi:MAG: MBL fold metallo-hydrolase [Candidatus Bruticola sp.]